MTTLKQYKPVSTNQWQGCCITADTSSINILLTTCPLPIKDHLNTIHAFVDSNGNLVEQYTYDAWGRVLSIKNGSGTAITKSAIGNRYLWQGREYSYSSGLYYFRARWYEPITGRWLSNDPIGISGGLNMYEFCGSNPVNSRDPMGLDDDSKKSKGFWDKYLLHHKDIKNSVRKLVSENPAIGGAFTLLAMGSTLEIGALCTEATGSLLALAPVTYGASLPLVPITGGAAIEAFGVTADLAVGFKEGMQDFSRRRRSH